MSGAGRSTAAKCLEDLGWFVVDNLPPALIPTMVDLGARSQGDVARIAVVVDVRGRGRSSPTCASRSTTSTHGRHPRVVFLEASDEALVRRFESGPPPAPAAGRRPAGRRHRRRARPAARAARRRRPGDRHLALNVHELRAKMDAQFADDTGPSCGPPCMSFGFKYGLPVDADLVVDVRFLPNPHWVPELRPFTGLDEEVRDFVFNQPGAKEFLDRYHELLGWSPPATGGRASGT